MQIDAGGNPNLNSNLQSTYPHNISSAFIHTSEAEKEGSAVESRRQASRHHTYTAIQPHVTSPGQEAPACARGCTCGGSGQTEEERGTAKPRFRGHPPKPKTRKERRRKASGGWQKEKHTKETHKERELRSTTVGPTKADMQAGMDTQHTGT